MCGGLIRCIYIYIIMTKIKVKVKTKAKVTAKSNTIRKMPAQMPRDSGLNMKIIKKK